MEKALLVVSFGTSHRETRDETIGAIESYLAKAMPHRKLYRAWTSRFIIKKLKERDGIEIDTVDRAIDRMIDDGIKDLLIVPTHMIGGSENQKMMTMIRERLAESHRECGSVAETSGHEGSEAGPFDRVRVSRPLLDTPEDLSALVETVAGELLAGPEKTGNELPAGGPEKTLVLMGHGSGDRPEANEIYVRLEEEFHRQGYPNVLVGTVEGEPGLEQVLEKIKSDEVMIAPLMIVAGDHAVNDMAGDDPSSWKNRIAAGRNSDFGAETPVSRRGSVDEEGTGTDPRTVIPVLRGLGSYPGVQAMFLEHAMAAEAEK